MSADSPLPPEAHDPDDLLAGEYVLGLLDGDEWRAARDRALVDAGFAARVQAWESRLSPLNAEFPEAPPPEGLLGRIEARLFPQSGSRFGWGWGVALGSVLAAAALLVLAVLTPQPPRAPGLQAELVDESGALLVQISYSRSSTRLSVTTTGSGPGTGQDYELWVIDDSGVPRSLGLLAGTTTEIIAEVDPGQTLAVSLEAAGGSPKSVPTGPVLAAAPLAGP